MIDFIKLSKELRNLKKQIENGILELECNPDRVINLSNKIERYLSFLFNRFSVKNMLVEKIKFWSEKIVFKCGNSSQLSEIINKLFEKFYFYNLYPGYFEFVRSSLNELPDSKFAVMDENELLSFYKYNLFMEIISQASEINLLKSLIQKSENSKNVNLKRVTLFCFKNTKKIPWNKKKELLWEWNQSPVFDFWKSKDCRWFVECPLSNLSNNLHSSEKSLYENLQNGHQQYYKSGLWVFDSYLLLKNIPELKKEVMEKETIFYYCEDYINKLNEKIYCNFLKNKKDRESLIKLNFLLKEAFDWNGRIREPFKKKLFRIKNNQNSKKNEELFKLLFLIYSVPEVSKSIKELECSEAPDFIIITHDGKKIALELTAIDPSEDVKRDRKGKTPSVFAFDPIELSRELWEKIDKAIERKKGKYNLKEFSESWLFLHINSETLATQVSIVNEIEKKSYISEIINNIKEEVREKVVNTFDKIYFMDLSKIEEIKTGKKFEINRRLVDQTIQRWFKNI